MAGSSEDVDVTGEADTDKITKVMEAACTLTPRS